jgi:ABC-2 type transport system permease protein
VTERWGMKETQTENGKTEKIHRPDGGNTTAGSGDAVSIKEKSKVPQSAAVAQADGENGRRGRLTRKSGAKNARTFKYAAWLGWASESNWTDPYLFAIYSVIRPLASMLIVVVMYFFVSKAGNFSNPDFLAFMFIGSAFYMFIFNVMIELSWVVVTDREHYQVLKYIYISPSNLYIYLLGRGFSKVAITIIASVITFIFGIYVLKIPIHVSPQNMPMLVAALVLGFIALVSFGIALSGATLLLPRGSGYLMESVAGIFYLFCGVLFPLSVLPGPAQTFGMFIPFTYWFEMLRRTMLHSGTWVDPTMRYFSNEQILGILALTTLFFVVFSIYVFKTSERRARMHGQFDMQTWY